MFHTSVSKNGILSDTEKLRSLESQLASYTVSEKTAIAEKNVALIRLIVIGLAAFSSFFLDSGRVQSNWLPILAPLLCLYAAGVFILKPYEKYRTFSSGWITSIIDGILSVSWLYATGGITSPYFVLFYASAIGLGYRFSLVSTMAATATYALAYLGVILALHQLTGNETIVFIRTGFIFILGYAGNIITNETQEQVRKRLETEALAFKAQRAEENLRQLNLQLEEKIRERTRELEASISRFQTLLEALPLMAWTSLPDGSVNYCNKAWYDFTGAKDLNGSNWESHIYPDDYERTKSRWLYSMQTGRAYEIEYRWVRYDGDIRWMLGRANPILDDNGKPILWIGSATDIHDRKTAEQQLEKRVHDRTRALLESNKELQRSNEELEQFAYVASHDLKEPLRMIASYSQLLLMKVDENDPEAREYAGFVENGVTRMKSLINDLLDYSRIGREVNTLSEVNLNAVMAHVKETLLLRLAETETDLHFEQLPIVRGNPLLLKQLFQNLLDNALKFRKPNLRPLVQVKAERKEGQWLISITDNGIGIPKEYHQRIFVIFQRLHTTDKYPGTGIGLAICKKIVEQHKGEIWLESQHEGGTVFNFTLPV